MRVRTLLIYIMVLLALPAIVHSQPQRCRDGLEPFNEPRHQDVICLPELGRMLPTLHCADAGRQTENFGQQIIPLGDIDGDSLADWIIGRVRCDTSVFIAWSHFPEEILLFHGVKHGLPTIESGERIGPTELMSSTRMLAVGDWDGDGITDLAVRIYRYGDTTYGAQPVDEITRLVIYWGSSAGTYSLNDTTQLFCGAQGWTGPDNAVSDDVDSDGTADLMVRVREGVGMTEGQIIPVPKLLLFRGHRGGRWGRDGITRKADWRWWNPPAMNSLASGDQDGDGRADIFLHNNDAPTLGTVSVLYGNPAALPDTVADVETINLSIANGKTSLFRDVTGDRIPELLVTSGSEHTIKVFVGLKGQRLKEQYGPGHASLDTASPHWWKRPWAEIWEPHKINASWPGAYDLLYNLGDVDLDGIGDIIGFNGPWLTVYHSGTRLDSLIDAMVDCRAAGGGLDDKPRAVAVLGDIDGSGVPTIAVGINGVLYLKVSSEVPQTGRFRLLPEGTGLAETGDYRGQKEPGAMQLHAAPNPARNEVGIGWTGLPPGGTARLQISTTAGEEILHTDISASLHQFIWRAGEAPAGIYFITLTTDHQRATTSVVLR